MDTGPEVATSILDPIMQLGFAGMSVVLIGVIVFMIRSLLKTLDKVSGIISENTKALTELTIMTRNEAILVRSVHDKLISRPCIARGEQEIP